MMRAKDRQNLIVSQVEKKGFASVKELGDLCQVNVMTIRRDLKWLEEHKKIRRTHGGAATLAPAPRKSKESLPVSVREERPLVERIDVLVASAPTSKYESVLPDATGRRTVPIVAESTPLSISETCVAVDNSAAGRALGVWAGAYARDHFGGQARVLDLTYHLSNTQERSKGFLSGVREVIPDAELILSINTQSRYEMAYQLTFDALTVHKNINIIFGMNDTSALGAIHACENLNIRPEQVLVLPFGIEGSTFCELIMESKYCRAGLAMFPQIVGPVCVEVAIALWNHLPVLEQYSSPFAVLTRENLGDYYVKNKLGWQLKWEQVQAALRLPCPLYLEGQHPSPNLPRRVGFVYTFIEHEWYRSLISAMQAYTAQLGIELEVVDVEQTLKDEIDWRQREIARCAFQEIQPGETISMDSGPISIYLAYLLSESKKPVTIISNAAPVLEILKNNPNITLISTGGILRRSSMTLVGPTAEATLREMRVDKLFLAVNGVSLGFGLSHNNLSEVTIKQAMIRSAHEVILLADHTCFEQEAFIQVAPVTAVQRLITDDALPASARLEMSKLGIRVLLASA